MPLWGAVVAIACINATMADDVAIKKLREAEAALDEGDVDTARSLAREVQMADFAPTGLDDSRTVQARLLTQRSQQIYTMSFVRDPLVAPDELARSVEELRTAHELAAHRGTPRGPQFDADFGEALERVRDDKAAFDLLAPLADRDLLGSPYANAALARISERKGDHVHADLGRARCLAAAARPSICRGEYPPRPFFRGRTFDFALAGFAVLGVALLRWLRRRVWSEHRARELSGAITVFGWSLFLLANARLGAIAAVATLAFAFVLTAVQRRLFFHAASEGNVPGFRLRPIEPGDEAVPLVRLFYGPNEVQTLEPTVDAGYRQSARRPLLRFGRKHLSGRIVLLLGAVLALLAGLFLSTLMLRGG